MAESRDLKPCLASLGGTQGGVGRGLVATVDMWRGTSSSQPWQLAPHTWKAISSGYVEETRCTSMRLLPTVSDLMPLLRGSPTGTFLASVVPGGCRPDASRSAAQVAPERRNVIGLSRQVTASWSPSTVKKACGLWG